jgi:hypothetical protein
MANIKKYSLPAHGPNYKKLWIGKGRKGRVSTV